MAETESKENASNSAHSANESSPYSRYFIFLPLVVLVFVVFVRIRLLGFPLERDEGEYAFMGQLSLKGFPLFKEAYTMKIPGLGFVYALFMLLFGQNISAVHAGLLITNAATILVLYLLVRRLFDIRIAAVSAAAYGLLSLSPHVLGFAAHATHFVVFFALSGILFLLKAIEFKAIEGKSLPFFALGGLMLGLGFLMKQHGMFFVLFAFAYLFYARYIADYNEGRLQTGEFIPGLAALVFSAALPFVVMVCYIYLTGSFERFWFWTFQYAAKYAAESSLKDGLDMFVDAIYKVTRGLMVFWIFAFVGLVETCFASIDRDKKVFAYMFFFFSILSITPGLYFRRHYFIMLFPALSLMMAIGLVGLADTILKNRLVNAIVIVSVVVAVGAWSCKRDEGYYFTLPVTTLSKIDYTPNPFIESIPIAEYIRKNTKEGDRVAILGSEPQVLFYSDRLSATGYIYMYGLMENHIYNLRMQEEMAMEIEKNRPNVLVYFNISLSWLMRSESPQYILNWFEKYSKDNYDLKAVIQVYQDEDSIFTYVDGLDALKINTKNFILIFKRKGTLGGHKTA